VKLFKNLNARKRRNLILGAAAVLFLIAAFGLSRPGVLKGNAPPVNADNLLGSADHHAIGIASMNREIDSTRNNVGQLSQNMKELEKTNADLRQQLSQREQGASSSSPPAPGVSGANYASLPPPPVPTVGSNGNLSSPYYGNATGVANQSGAMPSDSPPEIMTVGAGTSTTTAQATTSNPRQPTPNNGVTSVNGTESTADTSSANTAQAKPPVDSKPQTPKVFIPAGTMLTGVLITGLDAPTGREAASRPIPLLVRVKEDAVLPNEYSADYKECFIVASGTGDLSSERAYIRGETLSCVARNGGVIQSHIQMWATGEDGKAGMRGTLISKQGSAMAKAILAGFASGIGTAFTPQQQTTITSGGSGFTTVPLGTAGRMAVGGGVSNAAQEIARFYVKMADSEFPVIEVSAGRPVTFIVEKGAELSELQGKKE